MLVDVAHGHMRVARHGAQRRSQARREQGMAAQVGKEIGIAPYRLAGKQHAQRVEQRSLCRRAGQVAAGGRGNRERQRAQRIAVDLAGNQAWHLRQRLDMARHHVGRQAGGQGGAQRNMAGRLAALGDIEGHQLFDAFLAAQHHRCRAYAGLTRQHSLDLAKFHPEAADLDLVIGAAQALHLAIPVDACQVAGAVHAGMGGADGPGIGDEFFGGEFGAAEIAAGHAGSGDAEFAGLAARRQPRRVAAARLQYQQAIVGQGRTDGDRLARAQHRHAGRDRRLGRAVAVEDLPAFPRPARHQGLRTHLAAQVDDAQARHVLLEQGQQGGNRVQHGDAAGGQRARQRLGVGGHRARRDPERGADQVADPDFLERHVEGHGKALVDAVALAHAQHAVLAAQEVADRALADLDALGLAGGAGGIDHIGRIGGKHLAAPAQRRRCRPQQILGQPGGQGQRCQLAGRVAATDQAGRLRVFEAGADAGQRRVCIERQPGRAGLGDGRLHHQQVHAARQPQAHDLAGADAGLDQARCGQAGGVIEFRIGQRLRAVDQRSLVRHLPGSGFQQVGEDFVAKQIRPLQTHQQGRPLLVLQRIEGKFQACRFDIGGQIQGHCFVRQKDHSLADEKPCG